MSGPLLRPVEVLRRALENYRCFDEEPCAICRRPRLAACTPCGIPHDPRAAVRVLRVPRSPLACDGCLLQIGHELANRPAPVRRREVVLVDDLGRKIGTARLKLDRSGSATLEGRIEP